MLLFMMVFFSTEIINLSIFQWPLQPNSHKPVPNQIYGPKGRLETSIRGQLHSFIRQKPMKDFFIIDSTEYFS